MNPIGRAIMAAFMTAGEKGITVTLISGKTFFLHAACMIPVYQPGIDGEFMHMHSILNGEDHIVNLDTVETIIMPDMGKEGDEE